MGPPGFAYLCRLFFRFLLWLREDLDILRSLEETSSESAERRAAGVGWGSLPAGAPQIRSLRHLRPELSLRSRRGRGLRAAARSQPRPRSRCGQLGDTVPLREGLRAGRELSPSLMSPGVVCGAAVVVPPKRGDRDLNKMYEMEGAAAPSPSQGHPLPPAPGRGTRAAQLKCREGGKIKVAAATGKNIAGNGICPRPPHVPGVPGPGVLRAGRCRLRPSGAAGARSREARFGAGRLAPALAPSSGRFSPAATRQKPAEAPRSRRPRCGRGRRARYGSSGRTLSDEAGHRCPPLRERGLRAAVAV